jgi:hypothetical protein
LLETERAHLMAKVVKEQVAGVDPDQR